MIGGGSNSGFAVSAMCVYKMGEIPKIFYIIVSSDGVHTWVYRLPMSTNYGVITSSKGVQILGLFHVYVRYGKWKRIFQSINSWHF